MSRFEPGKNFQLHVNDQIRLEPAPLLLLVLPFATGIFCAKGIEGLDALDLAWLLALSLFCLFFSSLPFVYHRCEEGFRLNGWGLAGLLAAFLIMFFMGVFHEKGAWQRIFKSQQALLSMAEEGGERIFTGLVLTAPVPVENGCKARVFVYSLETNSGASPVNESLYVTFNGVDWREIEPGALVRFAARLAKVRNFKTPGSFDFENWWLIRKIMVRGWCSSPLKLVVGPSCQKLSWDRRLGLFVQKLRHKIMETVSSSFHNQATRSVAMAVLTGERAWFEPGLRQGFGASGLGHLLAVSGLHMAIIALFAAGCIRGLLGTSQRILLSVDVRQISYWGAVAACLFYTAMAGFSPSSLRAFFMVFVFGLSTFLNRPAGLKNCLAFAAIILLLLSPFYLFDISFQLSFFIVFFLIHFYGSLRFSGSRFMRWAKELLALSGAAFVFASPLIAFYFHRFALFGVPFNLVAVPLTEFLILPMLFLGLLFSWLIPGMTNPMWMAAQLPISGLVKLVQLSSQIQGIDSFVLPPSIAQLCLITALFLVAPLINRRLFRNMAFAIVAFLLLVTGIKIHTEANLNDLVLHVLDVGQGLCQVVQFPGGRTMVADAGGLGYLDIGSSVIAPYLRRLGIKRIDVLAVSHPERDHMDGVPALLRQFKVGQLWLGQDINPALDAFGESLKIAKNKGIPIQVWRDIHSLSLGKDARVTILPCKSCPDSMSRNTRCLVFRIGFHSSHILLPGDIGRWRERRLVASVPISSEIMVIPHHGSATSSSRRFLETVSPHLAICPCGYKNPFHLPSRVVLKRYDQLGIPVLRTDIDGTIDVKISRDGLVDVATYSGKRLGL